MGGETGTEHEIRARHRGLAQIGQTGSGDLFQRRPLPPQGRGESKQATQVLKFREEIRGLELAYEGADDFRDKIRDYLEKYLKAPIPSRQGD